MTERLSRSTLKAVPAAARPGFEPGELALGMVHLGVGAFWRAHAAVYTDDAVAAGDNRWGVLASSQRSCTVPDLLAPQDGLYSVLTRPGDGEPSVRVVGVVRDVACAADDPQRIVDAIATSSVQIVTLTVTEKGYRIDESGRLALDDAVRSDLAGNPPQTVVGQIVRGLQARAAQTGPPIAVMSCDNLISNGPMLQRLVGDFVGHLPSSEADAIGSWIESHVTFPATMVDRIVPTTVDADRAEVQRRLGVVDEACVIAEPFSQWVIADEFLGPRPAWEDVGAQITDDVASYERVKLRMLNATHSMIAYLGALAGYETIAEALDDERIEAAARALIDRDQLPTLSPPDDMDLTAYREEVLHRFANPALGHRTTQVASDGSLKLPQRVVGGVRERREQGDLPEVSALLIAAWIRAVGGRRDDAGKRLDISDPIRERLTAIVERPLPDEDIVRDVLSLRSTFGEGLADDRELARSVSRWFETLREHGALAAARQVVG